MSNKEIENGKRVNETYFEFHIGAALLYHEVMEHKLIPDNIKEIVELLGWKECQEKTLQEYVKAIVKDSEDFKILQLVKATAKITFIQSKGSFFGMETIRDVEGILLGINELGEMIKNGQALETFSVDELIFSKRAIKKYRKI